MQSLRHAPHRLGPPDRPGRRTSTAVFSFRGDSFPVVVSFLLLLAGDIELNPEPNCYACRRPIRRGMDSLQCQVNSCTNESHKQFSCSGFHRSQLTRPWVRPHGASGPPHRATTSTICDSYACRKPIRRGMDSLHTWTPPHRTPTTSTTCDSCQQPIRSGIRPLADATPNCPRLIHSARRCSGLSDRQGRWLCRQHQ